MTPDQILTMPAPASPRFADGQWGKAEAYIARNHTSDVPGCAKLVRLVCEIVGEDYSGDLSDSELVATYVAEMVGADPEWLACYAD